MNEERRYVRVDEHGAMRIGNGRVMLDSIVAGFEQGHSPETLQQQYPALSLEEVYGAITYYLAHTDEVHTYLKRQDELWEAWRTKSATRSSPVVQRLRALWTSEAPKRSWVGLDSLRIMISMSRSWPVYCLESRHWHVSGAW
jgi:uncharacterized protein (DUF433 family)